MKTKTCDYCRGDGNHPYGYTDYYRDAVPCPSCCGKGYVTIKTKQEIKKLNKNKQILQKQKTKLEKKLDALKRQLWDIEYQIDKNEEKHHKIYYILQGQGNECQ